MTLDEALSRLESLGSERMRAQYAKDSAYSPGVTGPQYGVKLGDIRAVAKAIKADHPLALQLWETGNLEARLLAVLIMKPRLLSADELDRLVRSNETVQVSDWLGSYIVKVHPEKEALRLRWMEASEPIAARAGWSLTAERIAKSPERIDIPALLDRIERDMPTAHRLPQWTMNNTLAAIGINHPEYRQRALAIGETLGIYRDYPCAPGCTSPFAPVWIGEMVKRAES